MNRKTIVIALGGNAIKSAGQKGTYEEQFENVQKTTESIAGLIAEGHQVVLTHGNGPQVGDILLQQERAKDIVPPFPMFVCGAETQGSIGLLIQQTLKNHLRGNGIKRDVVTIITQVLVSPNDKAFEHPSKPVGPFYANEQDFIEEKNKGYTFVEDAGRGYRRVVPSPEPLTILELECIKTLLEKDIVVIAVGGGGIPVYEHQRQLIGIDAVIDKDKAGQLLASELNADTFIVLTDVEHVFTNFNTPIQEKIEQIDIAQCEKLRDENQFAPGSMLPKIEAGIRFLREGGKEVIITHPLKLLPALQGETGTHITA
jgi:carbamate kinase